MTHPIMLAPELGGVVSFIESTLGQRLTRWQRELLIRVPDRQRRRIPSIVIRKGKGGRQGDPSRWFGACQCCGEAASSTCYHKTLDMMIDHLKAQGVRT